MGQTRETILVTISNFYSQFTIVKLQLAVTSPAFRSILGIFQVPKKFLVISKSVPNRLANPNNNKRRQTLSF